MIKRASRLAPNLHKYASPRTTSPTISTRYAHNMHTLTAADLNPAILNVQYAVRGELAIKAEEFRVRLQNLDHGLPFDKVVSSNIGNPQQKGLDQPPLTWTRQVCQSYRMSGGAICDEVCRLRPSWSTRRLRNS